MKRIGIILVTAVFLCVPVAAKAQQLPNTPESRLEDLRISQRVKITDKQEKQIIATCKKVQNTLNTLQTGTAISVKKRLVVYQDIQKNFRAIELRMFKQGADASELDLLIGSLQQQMNAFVIISDNHAQLANDLIEIDCAKNPLLFKAGMNELRSTRVALKDQSDAIRTTVLQSRQTTFNALTERLRL